MSRQNRRERFWTTPLALARWAEGRMPDSTHGMRERRSRMLPSSCTYQNRRRFLREADSVRATLAGFCLTSHAPNLPAKSVLVFWSVQIDL